MFIEARFPDDIRPVASGGPEYRTTIKTLRGGGEHRNSLWADPLRSYSVSLPARDLVQIKTYYDFVASVRGAAEGFRLKDWSDFEGRNEIAGVGDGTKYYFGIQRSYGTYKRRIMKPVENTVAITVDNISPGPPVTSGVYFVDFVNGNIVFKIPPPVGAVIRVFYQFDVPVRFKEDTTNLDMLFYKIGEFNRIDLREIRVREVIDLADYNARRAAL